MRKKVKKENEFSYYIKLVWWISLGLNIIRYIALNKQVNINLFRVLFNTVTYMIGFITIMTMIYSIIKGNIYGLKHREDIQNYNSNSKLFTYSLLTANIKGKNSRCDKELAILGTDILYSIILVIVNSIIATVLAK